VRFLTVPLPFDRKLFSLKDEILPPVPFSQASASRFFTSWEQFGFGVPPDSSSSIFPLVEGHLSLLPYLSGRDKAYKGGETFDWVPHPLPCAVSCGSCSFSCSRFFQAPLLFRDPRIWYSPPLLVCPFAPTTPTQNLALSRFDNSKGQMAFRADYSSLFSQPDLLVLLKPRRIPRTLVHSAMCPSFIATLVPPGHTVFFPPLQTCPFSNTHSSLPRLEIFSPQSPPYQFPPGSQPHTSPLPLSLFLSPAGGLTALAKVPRNIIVGGFSPFYLAFFFCLLV